MNFVTRWCICVSFPDIIGQIKVRSDTTEILACSTILPSDRDDWQRLYCVGVAPTTHNHRVIIDGPGSETVYNGHEFKTDLLYTRANQYISGKSKTTGLDKFCRNDLLEKLEVNCIQYNVQVVMKYNIYFVAGFNYFKP